MFKRVILLVMDSVGIGHATDAGAFGDEGLILWAILNRSAEPYVVLI